jgi:hypothetical protein
MTVEALSAAHEHVTWAMDRCELIVQLIQIWNPITGGRDVPPGPLVEAVLVLLEDDGSWNQALLPISHFFSSVRPSALELSQGRVFENAHEGLAFFVDQFRDDLVCVLDEDGHLSQEADAWPEEAAEKRAAVQRLLIARRDALRRLRYTPEEERDIGQLLAEAKIELAKARVLPAAERPTEPVQPPPRSDAQADGPVPPNKLRLGGKLHPHEFAHLEWRLLEALWDAGRGRPCEEAVPISQVMRHVYQGNDYAKEGPLRSVKKRLNRVLDKEEIPLTISEKQGYYILTLEPSPPQAAQK